MSVDQVSTDHDTTEAILSAELAAAQVSYSDVQPAKSTQPVQTDLPSTIAPKFPPPKTDKPRPHICTTCTRSFARLEHLKRHERSHTKEKPFECQSCTRCFARRDLLLRHQQKLHSTTTPSSRPRGGRRESAAGVATGRVRKNSTASTTNPAMRPRANTLSHVDTNALGLMPNNGFTRPFVPGHNHHNSFSGIQNIGGVGFRSSGNLGALRLHTSSIPGDLSGGLRTAPPYGGFDAGFEFDMMSYSHDDASTINPHALHTNGGMGLDGHTEFFQGPYSSMSASQAIIDDDGPYDWIANGFDQHMAFINAENAIESSPSAVSTNSPANFQHAIHNAQVPTKMENMWQPPMSATTHTIQSPISMDTNPFITDLPISAEHTISPRSILAQNNGHDMNFSTPSDITSNDHTLLLGNTFALPYRTDNVPSAGSTASIDSSLRQSSIATNAGDLVNERVRLAVVAHLSHASGLAHRRQSAPVIQRSPLSPAESARLRGFDPCSFPTTSELQRYASAYFRFCHPHLPFLHLPTLNFESSEYFAARNNGGQSGSIGGTCLLLSITAMGALYEHEVTHSKDLFEYAKRMISNYLENRRKSPANRTPFTAHQNMNNEDTPLWLVQAMLLNVIYGHNCGDKTSADIASNHCAALVSLARGAELAKPYTAGNYSEQWMTPIAESPDADWLEWKAVEERKRTLYSIFVLSSMLVMAYNRPPALTNSEIRLDLPCDEEMWSAESAQAWRGLGGMTTIQSRAMLFAGALTHLLTAAQREKQAAEKNLTSSSPWQQNTTQASVLKPSSFGCLVLIDALHNYIWETRQRHLGREWTSQEIEAMHAHIEPALRAWQAAWSSNPVHVIERPNPFGAGPLPADSIPLLDLAYVRLFVDFGRSKEAYWQRDFEGAADLATSPEIGSVGIGQNSVVSPPVPPSSNGQQISVSNSGLDPLDASRPSQREMHLRKAAFYAADHLVNADYFGASFFDGVSRNLPVQSVLCACDSAQVLAEWITILQERVGRYIGIFGRDDLNLNDVPAVIMLDDEDRKLLARIEEFVLGAEQRFEQLVLTEQNKGYGCRTLLLVSMVMSQNAVWPVTRMMAQSLEVQAQHVSTRVQISVRVES